MLMPSLIFVLMITIIGIPIALYLMAAPLLFLLAVGTRFGGRRLGGGLAAHLAAFAATLALLAAPPLFVNPKLERTARALVAGDHDDGTKPALDTIALRQQRLYSIGKDDLACTEVCQRALLNRQTARFLVVQQNVDEPLDMAMHVPSFRLERRDACPAVRLPGQDGYLRVKDEKRDWRSKRADELLQLEIAKGNCLIVETVPLGSADAIVSVGPVKKAESSRTLNPFVDTVRADRITLHERSGDGFAETSRWTGTVTEKLAPLYIPWIEGGAEFRAWPALARVTEKINITEKFYEHPDIGRFLADRLSLDLALRSVDATEETRGVLQAALARGDLANSPEAKVGIDFLENLSRQQSMEGVDIDIARRLLTNQTFPIPSPAWAALRYPTTAPASYYDEIAVSMFARLRAIAATDDTATYPKWTEDARHIASVIRELPRDTILKHRDDLEWLAKQDRVRAPTYQAVIRLVDFGAPAAPTLLWLIDDAQRFREGRANDWQHPYLAGLIGLCKIGPDASGMIEPLFDRLDVGVIANWSSYSDLAVNALVGMGANPEEIWPHVRPKVAGYKETLEQTVEKARRHFDREVKRARSRRDCSY